MCCLSAVGFTIIWEADRRCGKDALGRLELLVVQVMPEFNSKLQRLAGRAPFKPLPDSSQCHGCALSLLDVVDCQWMRIECLVDVFGMWVNFNEFH